MSENQSEPILLPDAPRTPAGIYEHWCEYPGGCTRWGGLGYARGKGATSWFCYEHRDRGEQTVT